VDGAQLSTAAQSEDREAPATSPLRILAVGNMYPPHHVGGYEAMWQAAMRHARSLGHVVRLIVSEHQGPGAGAEEDPDVHRTLGWYWDLGRYEFPRLNPLQRLELERHNRSELARHLREFRPDVVSWWSMGCMSLSLIEMVRRIRIPAVFVVHDDWIAYGRQHDQWIRMWRGKRRLLAPLVEAVFKVPTDVSLEGAGPFVFNSQYTLGRARSCGLKTSDVAVIPPGIHARFLEVLPEQAWRWRLAYVGRVDRQKGIDTAVQALARLPAQARLDVWGTGDEHYVTEMRALATKLGVAERVRFAGWAQPSRLLSAYREADAVLFPVRWEEPFGLVPLEAMGVGRAVITTARGGTREFVRHGDNALLFEADDADGLAQAVRRLASDGELRARLRDGGVRTAARYTVEVFAERTVASIVRAASAQPLRTRPPAA
jgi:glycogen(starch) synthase